MCYRPRAIHRPEFFLAGGGGGGGGGAVNIITCGEKSEKLSMYDASSGATISRGVLGDEVQAEFFNFLLHVFYKYRCLNSQCSYSVRHFIFLPIPCIPVCSNVLLFLTEHR